MWHKKSFIFFTRASLWGIKLKITIAYQINEQKIHFIRATMLSGLRLDVAVFIPNLYSYILLIGFWVIADHNNEFL